jgi:hypothetical protein
MTSYIYNIRLILCLTAIIIYVKILKIKYRNGSVPRVPFLNKKSGPSGTRHFNESLMLHFRDKSLEDRFHQEMDSVLQAIFINKYNQTYSIISIFDHFIS